MTPSLIEREADSCERARAYDLVIPKAFLASHPSTSNLFSVSRQFRTEIEAPGGYDTTETGK